MKTLVVIQARIKSLRLPRKTLLELDGKPLIQHTIEAVQRSGLPVVLAAPKGDDELAQLCRHIGVECYLGSEADVLSRIIEAAQPHNPELLVRICGDEPLLDPKLLRQAIEKHIEAGVEYSTTIGTLPKGLDVEVINFPTLLKVGELVHTPREKEHVTTYILEHPQAFRQCVLDFGKQLARRDIVLTVDTQADFEFVSKIYFELKGQQEGFALAIVELVDSGKVKRKPKLLLRADASAKKGYGDVITLMNIANGLPEWEPVFASRGEGIDFIKGQGFEVLELPAKRDLETIHKYCRQNGIQHALVELVPNDPGYVQELGLKCLMVDFFGNIEVTSDIVLNWDLGDADYNTEALLLLGPAYAPVSPGVLEFKKTQHNAQLKKILITMGGSDPFNLGNQIAKQLEGFEVSLVAGPGNQHAVPDNVNVIKQPHNLRQLISQHDLVISAGGFSVFELASQGMPFVGFARLPWEVRRLKRMEELGICKTLNNVAELSSLLPMLNQATRQAMGAAGQRLVDEQGVARIAKAINKRWL